MPKLLNDTPRGPCPECGKRQSGVTDSRPGQNGWTKRRRRCEGCGNRWITIEVPAAVIDDLPIAIQAIHDAKIAINAALAKARSVDLDAFFEKQPATDS